jgi:hypothetical protein
MDAVVGDVAVRGHLAKLQRPHVIGRYGGEAPQVGELPSVTMG